MKVRIKYNNWLAKMLGYNITLYPFILMLDDEAESRRTHMLHHEWIHIEQIRVVGVFKFYAAYLWYYFCGLIKYKNREEAYRAIPYEQEAYHYQLSYKLPEVLE